MGWQETIKLLTEPLPVEAEEKQEVCECAKSKGILKFTGSNYESTGNCSLTKICALIQKDKHQAKVSTSAFNRKKAYDAKHKPKPKLTKLDKFFMGE